MKKEITTTTITAAEAATTENIENQEEKTMKNTKREDALNKKRAALVHAIDEWYCNYEGRLQDLLKLNNWDRPEDFEYREEIQKIFTLTDCSHGAYYNPVRDDNACRIKDAIQAYVKEQPEEYFEEIENEGKELIDMVETEYRKFRVIKAVQEAPAEVFSEDEDESEELREKLINFYSSEPTLRFEDYKYDEDMDYYIYETMQDDMNSRAFLVY